MAPRRLDDLDLELRDSLETTVVVVTHELASIFTIGDGGVFLDAETKTMLAVEIHDLGIPHRAGRAFLRRGEAGATTAA